MYDSPFHDDFLFDVMESLTTSGSCPGCLKDEASRCRQRPEPSARPLYQVGKNTKNGGIRQTWEIS